ncbi:MAG: VWA domain-containing protein [Gemmataceae bacterium]|nr:VWA domain-containing protein [Gemmataceae bacterium]MCI0743167.1 VWA domain-containing protein [Gemmataceae bacterium]
MFATQPEQHLPGDTVTGTDPLLFALEFVGRMRKRKGLAHVPSLRTAIAIPRYLTARAFRKGSLVPQDYLDAAVLNTPFEDQSAAFDIAREVLFPSEPNVTAGAVPAAAAEKSAAPAPTAAESTRSILDDLAGLNVDLQALSDLSALDSLLETAEDKQLFQAFDLQQRMLKSHNQREQAGGRLVDRYGGAGELEARNIRNVEQVLELVKELLRGRINSLEADEVADACQAGHGPMLAIEVRHPWEQAGVFAGTKDFKRLQALLKDVLASGSAVELGRTLRFLEPHAGAVTGSEFEAFRDAGLERVRDLSEHAELLDGLRKWITPADELLRRAAAENPVRALEAARWLLDRFGENLQPRIFDHWADAHATMPLLSELTKLAVDCPRWQDMLHAAYKDWVAEHDAELTATKKSGGDPNEAAQFQQQWLEMAEQVMATTLEAGKKLAGQAVVDCLERICEPTLFLPMLDAFLERHIYPGDVPAVVAAGQRLGIDERLIYERLGQPLEQLAQLIRDGIRDPERFKRLINKIKMIPPDLLKELAEKSFGDQNLCGMAALLAIDMGGAAGLVPEQFAADACGYKGIGGGMNLLKQWFDGRGRLTDSLRTHIKELARHALVELAFDWIAAGSGSSESGIVPQNRARPYRAGDELDQLDLEATLDSVISQGKQLDHITEEDLFVPIASKGQAALCVLLDISGSMGGRELANCAISVVMLLGRLAPQELAITLFESDTHVIKGFHQERDLDEITDRLLELVATGGTRVDAALRWAYEQFEEVPEAEFRLLFLLSDFEFFESPRDLDELTRALASQNTRFLGAAHGRYNKNMSEYFQAALGGQIIKLRNLDAVPGLLMDAIRGA